MAEPGRTPVMSLPRLRQAVIAAGDLDAVTAHLQDALGLSEPYHDEAVAWFGLRNSVFALGDTFLEVVSPVRDDAPAARVLGRRGVDCGYMLMFQVPDLGAARERAREQGVREVFEFNEDDMAEVHLHPSDMRGAIVSLSQPSPEGSWRWAGPGWEERSAELSVTGAVVAVRDPRAVEDRWTAVLGTQPASVGVDFVQDEGEPGLVEIVIEGAREPIDLGGVRIGLRP